MRCQLGTTLTMPLSMKVSAVIVPLGDEEAPVSEPTPSRAPSPPSLTTVTDRTS